MLFLASVFLLVYGLKTGSVHICLAPSAGHTEKYYTAIKHYMCSLASGVVFSICL